MTWDWQKLQELKKARVRAIEMNREVFIFEGQEVLVAYAKYLIEYLESQLRGD